MLAGTTGDIDAQAPGRQTGRLLVGRPPGSQSKSGRQCCAGQSVAGWLIFC